MQRGWQSGLILLGLVALGVGARLLPHPPNFVPVLAASICGGLWLRSRWLAAAVPLASLALSDAVLGWNQLPVALAVNGTLVVAALSRPLLGQRPGLVRLTLTTLGFSALFFATTNFAVWAAGGIYPRSAAGLASCYAAAIPFFQYSLASDLLYLAALTAVGAAAVRLGPWREGVLLARRGAYARVRTR